MNEFSISFNIPALILSLITLLSLGACFFLIGYLAGKRSYSGVFNNEQKRSISFFQQQKETNNQQTIVMDERKYVVDIKTEGLEKKYDSLGEVKESKEDISGSISKLKNLKR